MRLLSLAILCAGLTALTAADDPKPAQAKPADWSAYATVGEIVGDVVKVGEDGFTLRVTWYTQSGGGGGRSSSGAQAKLKSLQQGKLPRSGGGSRSGGKLTEHHEDIPLTFADAGLVRWRKLPAKTNAKGEKVPHTQKELDDYRKPEGTPGYAAGRDELVVGKVVEATLVRPRSIPAAKATDEDLRVKYAIILGDDPTPEAIKEKKGAKKK